MKTSKFSKYEFVFIVHSSISTVLGLKDKIQAILKEKTKFSNYLAFSFENKQATL